MKRGLKVKSGVRAPAMPSFFGSPTVDQLTGHVIHENIAGYVECPNNNNCGHCWYCKQQAPR